MRVLELLRFCGFCSSILSLGSFYNLSLNKNAELSFAQQICVHMQKLTRVASSAVLMIATSSRGCLSQPSLLPSIFTPTTLHRHHSPPPQPCTLPPPYPPP